MIYEIQLFQDLHDAELAEEVYNTDEDMLLKNLSQF
jgi:hypothetical protein